MKSEVTAFLSKNTVGVLATISSDGNPQAATIFFVNDNNGGLVFKSRSASEHMLSLKNFEAAAIAVYDHNSDYKNKAGVQLKGTVSRITDKTEMQNYVTQYGQVFSGSLEKFEDIETLISPEATSTLYRFQIAAYKITDSTRGIADTIYMNW